MNNRSGYSFRSTIKSHHQINKNFSALRASYPLYIQTAINLGVPIMSALENHIADLIAATTFLAVICIPSIIYESILVLIGKNGD